MCVIYTLCYILCFHCIYMLSYVLSAFIYCLLMYLALCSRVPLFFRASGSLILSSSYPTQWSTPMPFWSRAASPTRPSTYHPYLPLTPSPLRTSSLSRSASYLSHTQVLLLLLPLLHSVPSFPTPVSSGMVPNGSTLVV